MKIAFAVGLTLVLPAGNKSHCANARDQAKPALNDYVRPELFQGPTTARTSF